MKAKSVARVSEVFSNLITDLVEQAGKISGALRNQEQRVWQNPGEWEGNPLDLGSITTPFDRSEIGANYEEVIADDASPGTVGDEIALAEQNGYVAHAERAFRASRLTPVRALAHAASARRGHANAKGIFEGGVLKYVEDTIQAGSS
jgi:hypothetical protein